MLTRDKHEDDSQGVWSPLSLFALVFRLVSFHELIGVLFGWIQTESIGGIGMISKD